jgi:hypothetical protein
MLLEEALHWLKLHSLPEYGAARRAYRTALLKHHPDKGGTADDKLKTDQAWCRVLDAVKDEERSAKIHKDIEEDNAHTLSQIDALFNNMFADPQPSPSEVGQGQRPIDDWVQQSCGAEQRRPDSSFVCDTQSESHTTAHKRLASDRHTSVRPQKQARHQEKAYTLSKQRTLRPSSIVARFQALSSKVAARAILDALILISQLDESGIMMNTVGTDRYTAMMHCLDEPEDPAQHYTQLVGLCPYGVKHSKRYDDLASVIWQILDYHRDAVHLLCPELTKEATRCTVCEKPMLKYLSAYWGNNKSGTYVRKVCRACFLEKGKQKRSVL